MTDNLLVHLNVEVMSVLSESINISNTQVIVHVLCVSTVRDGSDYLVYCSWPS